MVELSKELLDELGQLQSCAVANAIETFDVRPRNEGFMSPEVRCMFPRARWDDRVRGHGSHTGRPGPQRPGCRCRASTGSTRC